jgi:hypothetical protein
MSQPLPSPQPAPVSPTPVSPTPTQPGSTQPFLPNPSETGFLWLAVAVATFFAGYLTIDGLVHHTRRRRSERRWKERARRSALEAAALAQAQEAGRPLSESASNPLPPRR